VPARGLEHVDRPDDVVGEIAKRILEADRHRRLGGSVRDEIAARGRIEHGVEIAHVRAQQAHAQTRQHVRVVARGFRSGSRGARAPASVMLSKETTRRRA
jgi:hypothetical protein